jgi:hypothetical protein
MKTIQVTPEIEKHLTKLVDMTQQALDRTTGYFEDPDDYPPEDDWSRNATIACNAIMPFTKYGNNNEQTP